MLAVVLPAFMPCPICPPNRTDEECVEFQRTHGCHACDRIGCWNANPSCRFFNRSREAHADAQLGDVVPHMRETRITCTADGTLMQGRLNVRWWERYRAVRFTINDSAPLMMGFASGDECNCLIDTLRQQLHLDCDTIAVRAFVQARHADLIQGDYLELQHHWRDVIYGFAEFVGGEFTPANYKIICVDANFIGNGDVEGNGATILYIARQNANHFVPLLPAAFLEDEGMSSEDSSGALQSWNPYEVILF